MEKGSHNKVKTVFEISAGGVLYKREKEEYLVVLVAVKNKTVWTLPKGLVEKGEKLEDAAVREVREETGCTGEPVAFIDKIHLWFYSKDNGKLIRHHKVVYYYLMKYIEGDIKNHDFEVDDAKWFPIDQAINIATYKKDKEILKKARSILHEGSNSYSR